MILFVIYIFMYGIFFCLGDKVIVIGKNEGKVELFGTGSVVPGRQLHFNEIRIDSSKITFNSLTIKNGKPFYPDRLEENSLVLGQFYEWPNTYLFPLPKIN